MSMVTFPHLSPDVFAEACRKLADCFNHHGHLQHAWHSVKLTTDQEGQLGLQIVRRIDSPLHTTENAPALSSEPDGSDEEALPYRPSNPQAKVEYSIYPSPSYRVPVLYIGIQDLDGSATTSIDRMGDLLIPPHYKSQMEKVGIIGAVSMTNHPVTDMAVFFVHPCNTAEALEAAASTFNPSPLEYLQLWFGVVGACVGLDFPLALASQGGSL
ncbi:uncharacterized protein J3D65DRAFT_594805 [Phyllosticta citribraziliensis]|uniref:Ubiquitin-like-conjugating enzyme ATG10 n=1 Tax=Phyllosticta citribraziliensis TaxID=989973 RepID=A0ABR1LA77_9PEZI